MYGPLDSPGILAVRATEDDLRYTASPIITFWVNGHKADQEIPFESGTARQFDLTVVTGGEESEPVPVASGGNSFEIEGSGSRIPVLGSRLSSITGLSLATSPQTRPPSP